MIQKYVRHLHNWPNKCLTKKHNPGAHPPQKTYAAAYHLERIDGSTPISLGLSYTLTFNKPPNLGVAS